MSARAARAPRPIDRPSAATHGIAMFQPARRRSSPSIMQQQRHDRVPDAVSGPGHSKREHDLRNHLYLVASFTQLMRDGLAGSITERQKEFLGHVLDCTRSMRQLLDARD